MNKILLVSLVVISFFFIGVLNVGAIDKPVKVAIGYNIDGNTTQELVGTSVKEDLFGVNGLDYDLMLVSDNGETFYSDNKGIGNAISYNYNISDKLSVFVGAGINTQRIEKIETHRLGETDKVVYAGVGGKF